LQQQLSLPVPERRPVREVAGSEEREGFSAPGLAPADQRRRLGLARPPDSLDEPDPSARDQERPAQEASHLRLEGGGNREREAVLHQGQPRLRAAAEAALSGGSGNHAREPDRRRDDRPLRPAPRDPPFDAIDTST